MKRVYNFKKNIIFLIIATIVLGYFQALTLKAFIVHDNLIAGGFTGLAILIQVIFQKININISLGFLIFILNLPVALLCMKSISKKFVFLSSIQIISVSIFIIYTPNVILFHNNLLNIAIGAFLYAFEIVLVLKLGGSTGGTDFIALYVSHKINRTIWEYIFVFNMILIVMFGYFTSWDNAGYSIIFQFIVTKTISTFYNRYHRMTIQVITLKGDEIIDEYVRKFQHGITKIDAIGGYTKMPRDFCYTVVSVYEVNEIVAFILSIDKEAIINILKTEHFYGKFYIPEL